MILPGTEQLKRYPHIKGSQRLGIQVYGMSKDSYGRRVYKIPLGDRERVMALGYTVARNGTGYSYVCQAQERGE